MGRGNSAIRVDADVWDGRASPTADEWTAVRNVTVFRCMGGKRAYGTIEGGTVILSNFLQIQS